MLVSIYFSLLTYLPSYTQTAAISKKTVELNIQPPYKKTTDRHKAGKGPDPKIAALDKEMDEYRAAKASVKKAEE